MAMMSGGRKLTVTLVLIAAVVAIGLTLGGVSGAKPRAHAAYTQVCTSTDTAPHNPVNPLGNPNFKGTNPLYNAHLFVESPWLFGGEAANQIAEDVGLGYLAKQVRGAPVPWARFKARVNAMHLSRSVRHKVTQLEKIGDYPQTHRFASVIGPGQAMFNQIQYYLCRMQRTDPTAAGSINTYLLQHTGCASGDQPYFRNQVDAIKAAIGNFPVLIFIELDGTDTTCWKNPAAVTGRQRLIKYEVDQFAQLPHALLYLEAGASDANSVKQAAMMLNHEDAQKTRGFYLNDTHFAWSYKQIKYGDAISKRTGGLHYVIDTRANGNGPKVHPPPGIEVLCNPPGRAIGPRPGASDGRAYGMYSKYLDGFVWVSVPGQSGGKHCPGDPRTYAGGFDEYLAVGEASRANDRIGPTPPYKSRPW